MRNILIALAIVLSPLAASAQPDASSVVHQLAAGRNLSSVEEQHKFTDDVVCELHRLDRRWGHLRKNPGQTQVHGHAEDAALWLSDTPGQSVAVDFIGSAGAPNARPTWNLDQPRYSSSDWLSPVGHNGCVAGGTGTPTPPTPVVDLSTIVERLDRLETALSQLSLQLASVGTTTGEIAEMLVDIDQEQHGWQEQLVTLLDRITKQQLQPLTGRVFGLSVTFRPVVVPTTP